MVGGAIPKIGNFTSGLKKWTEVQRNICRRSMRNKVQQELFGTCGTVRYATLKYVQRCTERWTCFAKQQPGRTRHTFLATCRTHLIVNICSYFYSPSSMNLCQWLHPCPRRIRWKQAPSWRVQCRQWPDHWQGPWRKQSQIHCARKNQITFPKNN